MTLPDFSTLVTGYGHFILYFYGEDFVYPGGFNFAGDASKRPTKIKKC